MIQMSFTEMRLTYMTYEIREGKIAMSTEKNREVLNYNGNVQESRQALNDSIKALDFLMVE